MTKVAIKNENITSFGGECLEDINALIGQFRQRPDTLLPGADTVGRGLKELAEMLRN